MKVLQTRLNEQSDVPTQLASLNSITPDVILAFGAVRYFSEPALEQSLRSAFPGVALLGCSTAGEIAVDRVYDNTCILTAIKFERSTHQLVSTAIQGMEDSAAAGERLAGLLNKDGLVAVLVFGTGVAINGSALVEGLKSHLPAGIKISGGLAADAGAFKQTWTLGPDGCSDHHIVVLGLHGHALKLGYGTYAGWEPFGPARKVTRSVDNVLYELDGSRALDVYKSYLGEYAKDLPGSGLLFPFEMLDASQEKSGIFRTILGIDEAEGSLTLAGDIDPNGYLKLMHSTTEKLIDGAEIAAESAAKIVSQAQGQGVAILVSCIGRKLVMGDRVDEEVEAVAELMGKHTAVTGFYSNGEIAGSTYFGDCRLHNQTMTITWIAEG